MVQSCSHPSGRRPKKIDEILLKTGGRAIVAFQGGKTMDMFFFGRTITKKTASSCKEIMATNYEENNLFM